MKKFLVFVFCLLILSPCAIVLSACGTVNSYKVSVFASDIRYGLVSGGGTTNEGNQMTIRASTKEDSTFLCWTHNNKVVSNEPEYTFTVNQDTQGDYVALFDLGCEYYVITEADIEIYESVNLGSLNFKVLGGTTLTALQDIYNTTSDIANRHPNQTYASMGEGFFSGYLIHKKANKNDTYYCKAEATITPEEGEATTYSGDFVEIDFDELMTESTCEAKTTIENFGKIKLTIQKIDATLIKNILNITE